ncbi:MAG: hypothetical protein EA384_15620, partial [Spirochaetaceae bacterium]
MKPAILTAFFVRREEAQAAFRKLKREGHHRAAVVHKDADGRVEIHSPLLQFGFKRGLVKDLLRRLATEESALVLQAPIASLRQPVALLRESGEHPPLIFVLNPKRTSITDDLGTVATPIPPSQMQERAAHLAATSQISFTPPKGTVLLDRLKRMREWIGPVCRDLSEAAALGQRATPIVEWILDNQHIIDGSIRDVQQNLSRRFYRELPVLNDERHRGLPRIYGLARQIVSDTGLRLDRETVVAFLEAYQSVDTLTTAEL